MNSVQLNSGSISTLLVRVGIFSASLSNQDVEAS